MSDSNALPFIQELDKSCVLQTFSVTDLGWKREPELTTL